MRGVGLSWIKVGGQKRRVQIALHRTDATRALVKAQCEWLFERRAAAMTELAEFGRACGDARAGCRPCLQRCVSRALQTSLVLAVPRFAHTVSAMPCRKSSR
jgi:hypothetical protein